MTGLDKIIKRILDDAKDEARLILEAAQADCRKIAEEYAARAEKIRNDIASDAEKKGEATVLRARSAATMQRQDLLLKTRSLVLDEAFEAARKEILDPKFGKYRELLAALLTSALIEEAKAEQQSLAFGDEVSEFDCYEVIMNAKDREAYGASVIEDARRAALRHIGAERAAKLRLSEEVADIDGGLILRYGNTSANCSLSMLITEVRREQEARVAAILFADEKDAAKDN